MVFTPTIQQRRASVVATESLLAGLNEVVVNVANADLGPFFTQLDDLSRQVDAARVAVLGEVLTRGVVAASDCPSAVGWVIAQAPSYRADGAAQLVTVAHATGRVPLTGVVRNPALADAVFEGRVPVRNAAVVLTEMDKLKPRLRPEAVETVLAGFIQIATDHGPAQIRGLRDELIARYGQEGDFQRRADKLKAGVSLSQPFDDDGIATY